MRRLAAIPLVLLLAAVLVVLTTGASNGPGSGSGTYLVRAIFDNAAFAVAGEDVRIAGAPVGSIASLSVTRLHQAAVTLTITDRAFTPFHADATCAIRPQSLIAERYVDCHPGTANEPALQRVTHGGGAGSYLLPVARTSSPIDPDIVQNISQEPVREALAVILDELGTGLAARGSDLNAVILRANPALGATDRVFRILAAQNHVLARLAGDSQTVLQPLAKARRSLADFVVQANTTAVAGAERQAEISRGVALLPPFLRQLKPLMADLGNLANQGTPLLSSLGQSAKAVDREFANLIPFATQARRALIELGAAAQRSQGALVASEPLAGRLLQVGRAAQPSAALLDRLTASLDKTGAIEQLMGVLFYGTGATNGFDAGGHYVRTDALVGSCTAFARSPIAGCSANFASAAGASVAGASVARAAVQRLAVSPTAGPGQTTRLGSLLRYLIGSGR